jgi:hypothetical protein
MVEQKWQRKFGRNGHWQFVEDASVPRSVKSKLPPTCILHARDGKYYYRRWQILGPENSPAKAVDASAKQL